MKLKKLFTMALITLLALLCATGLAACGGNPDGDGDDGGGVKTYTIEAEYINLDGVPGAGISGGADGVGMIFGDGTQAEKDLGWSGGYYVGYTHSILTLDFVFNSDKAETATIILRLGSELGDITLTPTSFAVKLNGAAFSYGSMSVAGSDMSSMTFTDKTVTSTAALVAGENTISLSILQNTINSGATGGPMIDCVKLKTKAALTWTEKTDNPGRRGEI
ncbi:MAG: hypothetical protein LBL66_08250 [Clostridiales bacterium]|jgi:hypothetical protein|nr:hypothetical protein [Clostridiales bacterium]